MGLSIAEMFINIGIKGTEKSVAGLGKVSEGMGNLASSSLAAKASVLAVLYGLEKMSSWSAEKGMELKQFSDLTGLSTDRLQRWQYALRQSGVSAEETASSYKGLQSAIADMKLGKGPVGGLGIIAQYTKNFKSDKVDDIEYMMSKMREFAQNKNVPTALGNQFLKQAGLSETMISGLRSMKTDVNKVKPSEIFKPSEINRLAEVSVGWANLGRSFEMAIGHINAEHGLGMIQDISKLSEAVLKIINSFVILAEKLKLFKEIGEIFKGWGLIFDGLNGLMDKINGSVGGKDKDPLKKKLPTDGKDMNTLAIEAEEKRGVDAAKIKQKAAYLTSPAYLAMHKGGNSLVKTLIAKTPMSVVPSMAKIPGKPQVSHVTQNNTYNGDVNDAKGVAKLHSKSAAEIKHAVNDSSAKSVVN